MNLDTRASGKKSKTVVVPGTGDVLLGQQCPAQVGRHHAPITFEVHGRYYETIVPAVCVDPLDNMEQLTRNEANVAQHEDMQRDNVRSALFVENTQRSVDGRYTYLFTNGQAIEQRKRFSLVATNNINEFQKVQKVLRSPGNTTICSRLISTKGGVCKFWVHARVSNSYSFVLS